MPDRAGEEGAPHNWWDPGEKYPRLRVWQGDGSVLLSCRACGIVKGERSSKGTCPGVVRVELRGEAVQPSGSPKHGEAG